MKTIFITGCSTGFGRETAQYFLDMGWSVVATMRNPAASTLPVSDRLRTLPLDVTNAESIAAAVEQAGQIDVLVNNAGIGWLNAVEGTPIDLVRDIFETNLFGAIAMMQAVLPGMRERKSGVVVNVGSSSTLKPLPLLGMQYFTQSQRTVCDDSCVRVDHSSYAARPAAIGSKVLVRIYAARIEIREISSGALLRTHAKAERPGTVVLPMQERVFNPSRETRFILNQARAIGTQAQRLCEMLFAIEGRVGQRKLWGIRVHNVLTTTDAIDVVEALRNAESQ